MSEPYIGQIMQVGFSFAPRGWMTCQGQILSVAQNTALFSLLGTVYGGNGQSTFGLPDARGRGFIGSGQGPGLQPYSQGQIGGTENTVLTSAQMPMHTHAATFTPGAGSFTGQLEAKSGVPQSQLSDTPTAGCFLANTADPEVSGTPLIYAPATSAGTAVNLGGVSVAGSVSGNVAVGISGGSQPLSILSPYLCVTTVIAVEGIFPSRN